MARRGLPVIELFGPTIAGEGNIAGQQTHFIRFGLCTYRCAWCDSMHAVLPEEVMKRATWMQPGEIVDALADLDPDGLPLTPWVSLTGGNPAMHDLSAVVDGLHDQGYLVNVETQGDLFPSWIRDCDAVTVSPKPPSSGMTEKLKPEVLDALMRLEQSILKIVVFDEADLDWAQGIADLHPTKDLYLSVGTDPEDTRETLGERYRWLAEAVLRRRELARASVLPQLHVVAWQHALGV